MTDDPRPIRVERNYHPDGSLREEVHYRGSSSHGPWRMWHMNGVLAREYCYEKHVLADGTHRTWFSNGKLESELVIRGSRPVSEVWYSRTGRRVASPMDKYRAMQAKELDRWFARAAAARPPKRPRRPDPAKAAAARFIEERAGSAKAPARAWLASAGPDADRQLGELPLDQARRLVEGLFELGAAEVHVAEISTSPHDAHESANHVLITLPADPEARARLFMFERLYAKGQGFETEGDHGQAQAYLGLC